MNVLEVRSLTKKFAAFTAVRNIRLSLREGEILGLLGPNGAGKTTTIQMLLGVLEPTKGDIFYFGKNFRQHREEILEQVNFSSTYTNLPWDLLVRESLNFVAHFYRIADRRRRLQRIRELFKLEPLWNKKMHALSAGQITRVNLAKAFINFPKVLLLDEPTASLDPDVALFIRNFLLNERRKFQVSIILTSHNMAEVEAVCDRVIFIDKGRIVADDRPENLAKSIQICHVELRFRSKKAQALKYAKHKNMAVIEDGPYVTFDVRESFLSQFLRDFGQLNIVFDEISIQKPTLEDYFLQTIAKKS